VPGAFLVGPYVSQFTVVADYRESRLIERIGEKSKAVLEMDFEFFANKHRNSRILNGGVLAPSRLKGPKKFVLSAF
jgi:hypothetical protein